MAIGIDPRVDYAFKLLLGSPEHPAITLHFLGAILGPEIQITDVEILNPIQGKDDESDKLSILDIAARDSSGRLYDIEMQTSLPAGLAERLAYYTASLYVGQIGEGDNYTLLRPAISICVLNAVMFRDSDQIHNDFRLRSRDARLNLTEGLQIHLIELPKYVIPSDNRVITDPIEAWLCFFRQAHEMTTEEIIHRFDCPAFTEAAQVLEMIQRTPEQRDQYESRLKAQRDEHARLQQARMEGEAVGEARGKAEGEAQGEARGKLIGQIETLAGLLDTPLVPLGDLNLDELTSIAVDLRRQLRQRGV